MAGAARGGALPGVSPDVEFRVETYEKELDERLHKLRLVA